MRVKKILLVTCGREVEAEVERLRRQGSDLIVLTIDHDEWPGMKMPGVRYVAAANYVLAATSDADDFLTAFRVIQMISETEISAGVRVRDSIQFGGISVVPVLEPSYMLFCLANFIRQITLADELIRCEQPDEIEIVVKNDAIFGWRRLNHRAMLVEAIRLVASARRIRFFSRRSFADAGWKVAARTAMNVLARTLRNTIRAVTHRLQARARPAQPGGVLFLVHCRPHAYALDPVAEQVKKSGHPVSLRSVADAGSAWVNPFIFTVAAFRARTALRQLRHIDHLWRCCGVHGVPVGAFVERLLRFFVLTQLFPVAEAICAWRRVIIREQPIAIVVGEDREILERALFLVARKYRVPTLLMQVGLFSTSHLYRFPFAADRIAVEGPTVRSMLVGLGHDETRFVVTGQPKYDHVLRHYGTVDRRSVCHKYGLRPDVRLVLYTSQNIQEEVGRRRGDVPLENYQRHANEVMAVCLAFRGVAGYQLVVKPHPREDANLHQQVIAAVGADNVAVVPPDTDVYELMAACDALITRHSTTGLEALVFGKPLIVMSDDGHDPVAYVSYGAAIAVKPQADLLAAVAQAVDNTAMAAALKAGRERYIADFAFKLDGQSSVRVAKVIEEMLSSGTAGTTCDPPPRAQEVVGVAREVCSLRCRKESDAL